MPKSDKNIEGIAVTPLGEDKQKILIDSGETPSAKELVDIAKEYGLPLKNGAPDYFEIGKGTSIGWEYDAKSNKLLYASVIPSNIDSAKDFLDGATDYEDVADSDVVKIARKLYDSEGLAAATVDVLVETAVTDRGYITNVNDQETKTILQTWLESVNRFSYNSKSTSKYNILPVGGIEEVLNQALLSYNIDGDWICTEYWENVSIPKLNGKKVKLPVRITTHNKADLEFSSAAASLGMDIIYYRIPRAIVDAIKNPQNTIENKLIRDNTPTWLKKAIKKGEDKVPLPGELTTHIKRKATDFMPTGRSALRVFFGPMADKTRLRALDRATIVGLIQRLTIVMLGHKDPTSKLHIPNQARFKLLQAMFKKLKADMLLLWPGSDINTIDIGPDGKILDFSTRYKEVNDDLRRASTLPTLLTDGGSTGTSSRDWLAFLGVIARVESSRRILERWVEVKLRDICVQNNKKDVFPKYHFRLVGLRDDKTMKNVILKAWEDNLIGRRISVSELGLDAQAVIEGQIAEHDEKLSEKIDAPKVAWGTTKTGQQVKAPENGRPSAALSAEFEVDKLESMLKDIMDKLGD